MKQVVAVLIVSLCLMGCRVGELTEQEKQKVAALQTEVAQITKSIEAGEAELKKYASGLLPAFIQMRTEQEKLTRSLLTQQIAAIESGAKVTMTVNQSQPDSILVETIKTEIADIDATITEKTAEIKRYSGGLIVVTLQATVAQLELSRAALQHRLLSAKYGLADPVLTSSSEKAQTPAVPQQATHAAAQVPTEAATPKVQKTRLNPWHRPQSLTMALQTSVMYGGECQRLK